MDQTIPAKRILIVDDNHQAADIAAELLALYGHQTTVAYSGADGLRTAAAFAPDVILLDLGMPGMDGYEVATALRALPENRNLALVAFTAWGDVATRQRTRSVGFDQHITKPASLDEIVKGIGAACAMRDSFERKIA
ncbi:MULTISPECIES: response regulator [Duganella]|jgi:two-component system CheB/CheR fusion protein|uniref:response regulator n=1 Tax=Duganella TaxID=75654 RepID=UPI00159D9E9B